MGVTYTHGRDLAKRRVRRGSIATGELLLILTSAVTVLAIVLAYAGRLRAEAWGAPAGAPAPVNLNVITGAEALDAPLAAVFPYPADRQFALKTLASWLRGNEGPRHVPNVGALSRIDVPVGAIDRDPRLFALRERLEEQRRLATGAGRQTLSLFSPADLSAVKPLLSVRTPEQFAEAVLWCAAAMILSFHLVSFVWRWRGLAGDRILLALAHLLVGIGFIVMLSRPDPLRDTLLLVRYTQGAVIGVALFGLVSLVDIRRAAFRELSYLPLIGALVLSVVLLFFGTGPGSSNAKVNLGPVQPIEAIRLLLAVFLAGYFARRWELIRQVRTEAIRNRPLPRWIDLPRLDHLFPVSVGVGAALILFFLLKDLGPALLLSLMFLSMFAVARGGGWIAGAGLATLVAGFAIGYLLNISNTLAARVQMWRSPWDTAVRGGDQVAHGLWGMAAGAVSGTGAGLGQTRYVPEGHTDLVLAAIGEELGLAGLLIVGAAFVLIAWRGMSTARQASSDYGFFLALAMTLSLTIPVLVMSAGILGALPLTGVVTPFLSYGGSAMAANFVALGLLAAIRLSRPESRGRADLPPADLAKLHSPARWLWRAAAAGATAVLVAFATVQTLRADEYLVRPQLGVQADGVRRFQYNPRVLDALRTVPRGTIYDRKGLPIATSDPATGACPERAKRVEGRVEGRCYPAGPALFHVLGDATARSNWSAANTSYVERDLEGTLRGFDDRATLVTTTDRDGRASTAVRRDFAAAVPLVRHRFEPDHPAVQEILARPRDVRLTIDVELQVAIADILSRATRSAGVSKGAVVVLDAGTGEMLASVSYPWPGVSLTEGPAPREFRPENAGAMTDAWLDRARYGLYPPGSTFKMITAAAALREDPGFSERSFTCQRLPSNRIGVKIPGFGRAIHDDVLDRHPHGRLEMHDAVVRSCNAYFAQLAVALGSDVLARTAATAGIALNPSRSPERVRANLPHAGYGQGEVLVTPLRIARVAAALATDGVIRETPLAIGTGTTIETPFVSPAVARTLAEYLRDAVVNGTGRALKNHPAEIAGKTGTAEVDEAASHAWFVGFAPYRSLGDARGRPLDDARGKRRIAFAVVLEHAGYGGGAAAAVAGQVATAASAAGQAK